MKSKPLLFLILLCLGILLACSNNDKDKSVKKVDDPIAEQTNNDIVKANEQGNELDTKSISKDNPEADNEMNLGIGDSAVYKKDIGIFKMTLVSAKIYNQLGEEKPYNDLFVKMQIKITNVGKSTFTVADIFDPVLIAGEIPNKIGTAEDNVVPDIAYSVGQKNALMEDSTDLEPGESKNGVLVFDIYNNDFFTLGLYNDWSELEGKASWKVTKEEMQE